MHYWYALLVFYIPLKNEAKLLTAEEKLIKQDLGK